MEKKAKAPRVISDTTLDRYLGAILALRQRIPIVRSVDVANHLGNSKACVSMALKQMILQELVRIGPHGALLLFSMAAGAVRRGGARSPDRGRRHHPRPQPPVLRSAAGLSDPHGHSPGSRW